ncbi:MAG: Mrp/NBP35 family ATP-binding protein [Pseudomonadota bacterium]
MGLSRDAILDRLRTVDSGDGRDLVARDMVRALAVDGDSVRFVIEADDNIAARDLEPARAAAEAAIAAMEGVAKVTAVLTAPSRSPQRRPPPPPPPEFREKAPPQVKIGRHPKPQAQGRQKVSGVDRILAIGSGKGGVGKSTVTSNLAVALAKAGRRVGLLDADVYGPSQPRMMGITDSLSSPDGKVITPLKAYGVTVMSIGFMLADDKAVIWRGPMLIGSLQQMLTQVEWGRLDVLLVDLPPGTGDVAMTLCQRTAVTGAIVVSTPQDVALLDARKALNMFEVLKTPVLGLIENMSIYCCPQCGHEEHIFGEGGVKAEAERLGVPLLGSLPLTVSVRQAGDAGTPIALGNGPEADAFDHLAQRLIGGGMA